MVRGVRDKATQAPGYGAFGSVMFNPTADLAIQKIFDVNQLSDFGIKFPFQNGSTTILNQASNTTLSPTKGVLYYDELNLSAGAVVDVGASPCFIFARKITIASGCVLHCDARGGAGGAATTGGAGSTTAGGTAAAGTVGNAGGQGDLGATALTDPPQFYKGIATGGAGGGSGAGGGGILFVFCETGRWRCGNPRRDRRQHYTLSRRKRHRGEWGGDGRHDLPRYQHPDAFQRLHRLTHRRGWRRERRFRRR